MDQELNRFFARPEPDPGDTALDNAHLSTPGRAVESAASESWGVGSTPEVSVVVSSRNREGFLAGLLEALSGQTLAWHRFEVVVVDDASTDATWSGLVSQSRHTDLRLLALRLPVHGGQGPGRNAGVMRSRGGIVAFTDDDCIPASGWLETLTAPFRTGPAGQSLPAIVVQGRTVPWAGDEMEGGAWARTIWVLRPTWLFETCNIAYRRVDIDRAGGFPGPNIALADATGKLAGEDALLGWEVVRQGADLTFVAQADVYHRHLDASYGDWVRAIRGRAVFPALVRRNPDIRRALWARYFLAPRTAAFDAGAVCAIVWAATRRGRWLVGGLPWLWLALPEAANRRGRHPALRMAQIGLGDLVGLCSMAVSSLRHRRAVL